MRAGLLYCIRKKTIETPLTMSFSNETAYVFPSQDDHGGSTGSQRTDQTAYLSGTPIPGGSLPAKQPRTLETSIQNTFTNERPSSSIRRKSITLVDFSSAA